ncbi:hypothetical protein PIB30_076741 [Stylosanthes scabra]|uniref:Uncharacterized protein n=1 Tax=Stylosanthes scabra TaxID=79078 RepID=A0ABU6QPY7_9FABA|nr:hypothetical protein [Stylosanthes scabra]
MAEIKKQLKDWSLIASAKETYCYLKHQQANPNLVKVPIKDIPKMVKENLAKGKHMFYGALKSHQQGESSSQAAPPPTPTPALALAPPQPQDQHMAEPDS